MAESAACPAFQLGRPRYDQVSPPLSSANHPLMGFCFQAFRWKTAPSSALQPLRMLRQFVGTKLALICDPILRCLYLNRSNFQLLVNLVEMDEFWLYCSFHSGNDFSSAVPYQCFMRVHASSTHGYITARICSQHTDSSPSVVFSQTFTIIGCLSFSLLI